MELELAITSYQRLSPTVTSSKTFTTSARYLLGRSKECDWCLPDPDRVVSSRHAEIFFQSSRFWLRDTSTNGVFINGAAEPLGGGGEVVLANGDRLRFGDYELKVSLGAAGIAEPEPAELTTSSPSIRPPTAAAPALGDLPVSEGTGGNPTLASGLNEQRLGDSHVEIPDVAIPPIWNWGEGAEASEKTAAPAAQVSGDALAALFTGLGMPQLAEEAVSPVLLHELGDLTRILLERLLDLLHVRAAQKQKLRVQQTLFQRSENNPLKFSATAQDAIEALLVRRHSSFLGPREAVEAAFADVLQHEAALMAGVERVVTELLQSVALQPGSGGLNKLSMVRKARAYDALVEQRAMQASEFGDSDRMLRSDTFIDAYESAARIGEKE